MRGFGIAADRARRIHDPDGSGADRRCIGHGREDRIKAEYSRYLTSDNDLTKVSTALAKHLGIDEFAPMDDLTRPDLVFTMADSTTPHIINVVELKSPSIPLDNGHLTQLETYVAKLVHYAETEFDRPITVHGFLIGAMPEAPQPNDRQLLLLEKIKNAQPWTKRIVMAVRSLLERAYDTRLAVIKSLASDLDEERDTAARLPDPAEQMLLTPAMARGASAPVLTLIDGKK